MNRGWLTFNYTVATRMIRADLIPLIQVFKILNNMDCDDNNNFCLLLQGAAKEMQTTKSKRPRQGQGSLVNFCGHGH